MSGLLLIVRRSLRQHALSTTVTVLSVALATGLTLSVFSISAQARRAFTGGDLGFDAVLGARGSALQLVLNAVFHLETSPGNIPWTLVEEIAADPRVAAHLPYAVGDNYYGYRIVGTTDALFGDFQLQAHRPLRFQSGGRPFDSARREAVLGSEVARRTGLTLGSVLHPYHGLVFDVSTRHDVEYVVVGVLEPTGGAADRVIWIPIEGVFRMEGHVLRGTGQEYTPSPGVAIPDEHKEVSAVLLRLRQPQAGFGLRQLVNHQGKVATLAWPIGEVMIDLFNKLGWVNRILELVALLVMVVAAASILASITNAMNERRREFAILRALGARRRTVFSVIVLESTAIAALGCAAGFLVHGALVQAASAIIRERTGVTLDGFTLHPALAWTPVAMVALGALAGVWPARRAYATEVARHLAAG